MNHIWDYSNTLYQLEPRGNRTLYSSISYTPRLPVRSSLRKTIIGSDEAYRPDKIAFRLYNNPLLSWVLDEANSFYSFKDYTINKEILYPSIGALEMMNISIEYNSYKDENFG